MGRVIIAIVLIGIVFWALHKWRRRITANVSRHTGPAFEKTVQCAQCSVYVGRRHAFKRNGRYYCCAEHLPE